MVRKRQVIAAVAISATRFATAAWAVEPAGNALPNSHVPAIEDPYPSAAKALNLPGHAMLGCSAAADGSLHNCKVVSEDPPSWGFGQGALKAATAINFGAGAPDRFVQVPIGFELDENDVSNPLIKTRGHLVPDDQTVC